MANLNRANRTQSQPGPVNSPAGHSPAGHSQTGHSQSSSPAAANPPTQPLRWPHSLSWLLCGGITLALLAWSLQDLSLAALGSVLAKVNYGWLAVGLGAYLGVFVLRAWRWGLLLAAECWPGRLGDRFNAFLIGYAANSILPASAGEVVRAVLLNRFAQVPIQPALGSVLGEKLMDVLVVFLILVGLLSRQPQLSDSLPWA